MIIVLYILPVDVFVNTCLFITKSWSAPQAIYMFVCMTNNKYVPTIDHKLPVDERYRVRSL